ncbi:hypothetical protein C3L33_11806, partial [Rhododendron williamsianum]
LITMKRSRTTPTTIFSIPNTILREILSKLPISTICNCKCVCSYFRNLISDPQFAQLHLSKSQPPSCFPPVFGIWPSFSTLMILNNGDILLLFDSSLIVSYSMRYRSCRMVRFNGIHLAVEC